MKEVRIGSNDQGGTWRVCTYITIKSQQFKPEFLLRRSRYLGVKVISVMTLSGIATRGIVCVDCVRSKNPLNAIVTPRVTTMFVPLKEGSVGMVQLMKGCPSICPWNLANNSGKKK